MLLHMYHISGSFDLLSHPHAQHIFSRNSLLQMEYFVVESLLHAVAYTYRVDYLIIQGEIDTNTRSVYNSTSDLPCGPS